MPVVFGSSSSSGGVPGGVTIVQVIDDIHGSSLSSEITLDGERVLGFTSVLAHDVDERQLAL